MRLFFCFLLEPLVWWFGGPCPLVRTEVEPCKDRAQIKLQVVGMVTCLPAAKLMTNLCILCLYFVFCIISLCLEGNKQATKKQKQKKMLPVFSRIGTEKLPCHPLESSGHSATHTASLETVFASLHIANEVEFISPHSTFKNQSSNVHMRLL